MTELKPCPFCGSTNVKIMTNGEGWWVECLKCGAMSGIGEYSDDEAIETWNRRAALFERPNIHKVSEDVAMYIMNIPDETVRYGECLELADWFLLTARNLVHSALWVHPDEGRLRDIRRGIAELSGELKNLMNEKEMKE